MSPAMCGLAYCFMFCSLLAQRLLILVLCTCTLLLLLATLPQPRPHTVSEMSRANLVLKYLTCYGRSHLLSFGIGHIEAY